MLELWYAVGLETKGKDRSEYSIQHDALQTAFLLKHPAFDDEPKPYKVMEAMARICRQMNRPLTEV